MMSWFLPKSNSLNSTYMLYVGFVNSIAKTDLTSYDYYLFDLQSFIKVYLCIH